MRTDVPRHARTTRNHRAVRAVALSVVGVLTFVGVGLTSATARLQGNIGTGEVSQLLGGDRPEKVADPDDPNAGKDLNILLMGSDSRGDGEVVDDGVGGMRSDTTIVLHVAADRSRAELVSIPRDSFVQIPSCTGTGGGTSAATAGRFNAAFSLGWSVGGDVASAAACTIKTVESLTGVFIDHYAVVNFAGFEDMVDALGGVPICVPNDIDAPKADLKLTAGFQTLKGKDALGFARARTGVGVGDGSDTNRIGRQQQLMSAMVNEALSQSLVTDLPKLYSFLDAGTSSLTTNPELASVPNLAGLAYSLRGLRANDITFMTIPWIPNPADINEVVWTDEAMTVWQNIAADEPIVAKAEDTAEPVTPSQPEDAADSSDAADSADSAGSADAEDGADSAGSADAEDSADSAGSPDAADPNDAGSSAPEPESSETKSAGREAFTGADVTAECG
jgi:LCP family protein required for cell wall assembly